MKKLFIGTWKLVAYKIIWPSSKIEMFPFGPDAKGYLIYTDHHVSVHVMRSNRQKCSTEDYRGAKVDEKIEMADNYAGYIGIYEINQNIVIHHPEVSMYQNFTLTPQQRQFQFNGNQLILECAYSCQDYPEEGCSRLVWERIEEVVK